MGNTLPSSCASEGLASVAALMADASRAEMLMALLDGRAISAGELARAAGVTPQTASGHLARLADGGLVAVNVSGRRRYYRIADAEVAHAIEALSAVAPETASTIADATRLARTCYDHLAGYLGTALADVLVARGTLILNARDFELATPGRRWFADFGVDLQPLRRPQRKFAPACLDVTERRPHVGGALGAAMKDRMFEAGWFARMEGTRALRVTLAGRRAFERELRIAPPAWM